jgi:hypothetical protein
MIMSFLRMSMRTATACAFQDWSSVPMPGRATSITRRFPSTPTSNSSRMIFWAVSGSIPKQMDAPILARTYARTHPSWATWRVTSILASRRASQSSYRFTQHRDPSRLRNGNQANPCRDATSSRRSHGSAWIRLVFPHSITDRGASPSARQIPFPCVKAL